MRDSKKKKIWSVFFMSPFLDTLGKLSKREAMEIISHKLLKTESFPKILVKEKNFFSCFDVLWYSSREWFACAFF